MEMLKGGIAKRFTKDVILNLLASFTPLLVLQFFLLPALSKSLGDEKYGLLVTIVALMNAIPGVFGNALNNIRLLKNGDYIEQKYFGDFNLILLIFSACGCIFVTIGSMYYEGSVNVSILLTALLSFVWVCREYFVVAFRIELNYRAVLINNLIMAVGYWIGFLLVTRANWNWQWIYIIGYSLSMSYIMSKSDLYKESIKSTPFFYKVFKDSVSMSLASFLMRMITYADKLLIFPMLGAQAVAVYYASSVFSKSIMMGITPITGVVLSYATGMEKRPRLTLIHVLLVLLLSIVAYIVSILISLFLLNKLYPEYAMSGGRIVYFMAFSSVLEALSSLLSPLVLRFNRVIWQLRISALVNFVYIALVILLAKLYSLLGFSIALCVASTLKLILLIWVYTKKPDIDTSQPNPEYEL